MNWENIGLALEEGSVYASDQYRSQDKRMQEELNEDEMTQLKKFQDPAENIERQACITLLTNFGDLLVSQNITGMIDSVLSNDCEFFIFSSTGRTPAQHYLKIRDLAHLYKGMHIQERIVRETYIDQEKGIACQLSNFKILYEGEDNPVDEIAAEMFTIKDNKISKYRAFLSKMTPVHGDSDPFETTKRDKTLAMVKRINYALAGQPNFNKVADFLHENAKYKIWTWDSQKCYILEKCNFVKTFKDMQENFVIKSIVPYDVSTQGTVAVGTYVYHLEGKTGDYANKNYVWLSTCYYLFDNEHKLIKVSQQGELYLKGEGKIQSVVYSREKLLQKVQNVYSETLSCNLFFTDVFALEVTAHIFGPEETSYIGVNKGPAVLDKIIESNNRQKHDGPVKIKLIESIVDCCDSNHDVVILIHHVQRVINAQEQKTEDSNLADIMVVVTRYKIEQGKIIKVCGLMTPLSRPLPSSFE